MAQDYTGWSHEDLIKRVTQLESDLKTQNEKLSSLLPKPAPPSSTTEPSLAPKKKKKPTPFDPTKYHTRPIALKFAYLGGRYNGFEHHIGNSTPLPTIEEELWKALVKTRLIFPPGLYGPESKVTLTGGPEEVERLKEGPGRDVVGDWTGCGYSKCGRTDRGVSAFGQVIGVSVRSSRPKEKPRKQEEEEEEEEVVGNLEAQGRIEIEAQVEISPASEKPAWDPMKDELPYIALLNRVLPPDIRILAWCPHPHPTFDARFSCKERKYRYFFTSPAFLPLPGPAGLSAATGHREGWLDIPAMEEAASYLVGTHDFRNFCKVDASKQLTSFTRRITDARILRVAPVSSPDFVANLGLTGTVSRDGEPMPMPQDMKLYSFDVQGSAFLWHQVRCMVAVLFLVGQGLERPYIVKELLDVGANPRKPQYEMASDQPLVLWDCMFSVDADKGKIDGDRPKGYIDRGVGEDELEWLYAADAGSGTSGQVKWGPLGVMSDLWRNWRKAKIDEVLAAQLLDLVALQGKPDDTLVVNLGAKSGKENQRVFEGYDNAESRGKYVPILQRPRLESVEVINEKWATRKGRTPRQSGSNGGGV